MPHISFNKVSKFYGDREVIHEFDAQIEDREFLVLLGPSGCGKSTMLRMIAGLSDISSGQIAFDGRVVNELEPRERNIAFVFQSYALYPHMTVRENIAFPLVMDRFKGWYHIPIVNSIMRRSIAAKPEVKSRVVEVAEMLELTDYLDRRPRTLSGGQRQRVAVGRALVRDPSLYLLDEPLSNLDAKLRAQMREEISALYRRVGKTFIYVTHDQVEAMTMATRIIVLNNGKIQQIGTPEEIYNRPVNIFVARFIGSPAMNLIPVTVSSRTTMVRDTTFVIDVSPDLPDGQYLLGIRPEKITIDGANSDSLCARISVVEHLGGESIVGFRFADATDPALSPSRMMESTNYARIPGTAALKVGNIQKFNIDTDSVNWFAEDSGEVLHPTLNRRPC